MNTWRDAQPWTPACRTLQPLSYATLARCANILSRRRAARGVVCAGYWLWRMVPTAVRCRTTALRREWTVAVAKELNVVGLINIQFAIQDDVPYIIEANPRASR